jgi:hypothetical protein
MPADAGLLAAHLLLAAFAGGALGAALGAVPTLSLAGLFVVLGEVTPGEPGPLRGAPAAAGENPLTALVGLGPGLGPHVAFAGGAAATAYAARKGYLDTDFEYHEAKHVTLPLGSRPDVLLVGGVFGVVGYWLTGLSLRLGLPWEPVAASVVLSGLLHRLTLGYPLLGHRSTGLFDMTPYETGDRRMPADGSEPGSMSGRLVVEPWQPAHYEWGSVGVLGVVVGLFAGFLAVETGSPYLAFGVALATLGLAAAGVDSVPVTHHVALPASVGALALPSVGPAVALVVAAVFGLLGALVGEFGGRLLYAHADTHLAPSFVSILVTSVLIAVLDVAGVFTQSVVPTGILG